MSSQSLPSLSSWSWINYQKDKTVMEQLNDLQNRQDITYMKNFPKINTDNDTYKSIISNSRKTTKNNRSSNVMGGTKSGKINSPVLNSNTTASSITNTNSSSNITSTNDNKSSITNSYSTIRFDTETYTTTNPIIENNSKNENHKSIINIISKKTMTDDDHQQLDKYIFEEGHKLYHDSFRLYTIFSKFVPCSVTCNIQPDKKVVCKIKGAKPIKDDIVDISKLNSNKKITKGMAIVIDPRVNTNGEEFVIRLHYEVLQEKAELPGFMCKVTKMTDIIVCGNGNSYKLKFIASFLPFEHDFDIDIDVVMCGWNGLPPIFIPAEICHCELICPVSTLQNFDASYSKSTRAIRSAPIKSKSSPKRVTSPNTFSNTIINEMPNVETRPKSAGLFNSLSTNRLAPTIPKVDQLVQISFLAFPVSSAKFAMQVMKRFLSSQWYVHTIDRVIPGGLTALSYATMNGNFEFVEKLLNNGADVDAISNGTKCPALHEAIQIGDVDIFELLLKYNASQLIVDVDGMTAMHKAAKLGQSRMLSILLKAPKAKEALKEIDRKGRTALDVASGEYIRAKIYASMVSMRLITHSKSSLKYP